MSDRQKIEYNLSYTRLLAILNSEVQNIWNHGMVTVSPQIAYIFVQKKITLFEITLFESILRCL